MKDEFEDCEHRNLRIPKHAPGKGTVWCPDCRMRLGPGSPHYCVVESDPKKVEKEVRAIYAGTCYICGKVHVEYVAVDKTDRPIASK